MQQKFNSTSLLPKLRMIVQGLIKATNRVGGRMSLFNYDILEIARKWAFFTNIRSLDVLEYSQ